MRAATACMLMLAACGGVETRMPPAQDVTLFASDGAALSARRFRQPDAAEPVPGLLLIHDTGGGPRDWDAFAEIARAKGYAVLAAGFRLGEPVGATSEARERALADLAACKQALVAGGADLHRLGVMGAGDGACLALDFAASNIYMMAVVLLSPPMRCGDAEMPALAATLQDCPLLLMACEQDAAAADAARNIDAAAGGFRELRLFAGTHRGIDIPMGSASASRHLFAWLEQVMPE